MSEDDRKVCMVDDMEGLTPLAEAYARARGTLVVIPSHSLGLQAVVIFIKSFVGDMNEAKTIDAALIEF